VQRSRRIRPACKARSTGNNNFNGLATVASHPARAIAAVCTASLVLSSAGFGAIYAWTTASQHGLMLGACAVLMAVALEGAKPLAVSATLAAFRAWAFLRGFMLALLAIAAIAFSLTSELALIGGTRGDVAAKRASVVEQNEARHARLQDARTELSSLALSRPAGEIEADVAKLLADNPKAGDCHVVDGPVSRTVCPQVAMLNGEIARTRRRAELQAAIAKLTDAIPATTSVGAADPASSALGFYLGLIGVTIAPAALSQWLILVPVLALELGAALAAVLVQAVAAEAKASVVNTDACSTTEGNPIRPSGPRANPAIGKADRPSGHPRAKGGRQARGRRLGRTVSTAKPAKKRRVATKRAARERILGLIEARGGRLEGGSVRTIAKLTKLGRTTVHSALGILIASGSVVKAGKALVLANGG
jgi:hypothetical protein